MKLVSIAGALALALLMAACGGDGVPAQNSQNAVGPSANATAPAVYSANGNVTAVAGDRITISHGPVEQLGWPAMTMTFRAGEPAMLQSLRVGDRVAFRFRQNGTDYPLTAINKTP